MSFTDIKPYFEERMSAVDPDLREWEDGFSIDNIPSTIIDKSYHFGLGVAVYRGTAHTCMSFDVPVTIRVILKGYNVPKEAIDNAWALSDAIVKECTDPVQRLNQAKIKNILPNLVSVRELSQTNDNVVVLEMQFNCNVLLESKANL